jgi:hypothetical protein
MLAPAACARKMWNLRCKAASSPRNQRNNANEVRDVLKLCSADSAGKEVLNSARKSPSFPEGNRIR